MVDDREMKLLQRCVDLAAEALRTGDQPFGSVLVGADGAILAEDRNRTGSGDPTRHPEFELARWAAANLDPAARSAAKVFTSGEHCPMCAAAHARVGLGEIVYAASSAQLAAWLAEWGVPPGPVRSLPIQEIAPKVPVRGPIPALEAEVRELYRRCFAPAAAERRGGEGGAEGARIQILGPTDLDRMRALIHLFGEVFEDTKTYGGALPGDPYLARLLGNPSFIALTAVENGEVVGGLTAYELPKFEQERSELYIYDLAVAAAHRRRGIATSLIRRIQELAVERGAWVILIQADRGDEEPISLYSKLGKREDILHFEIPPASAAGQEGSRNSRE